MHTTTTTLTEHTPAVRDATDRAGIGVREDLRGGVQHPLTRRRGGGGGHPLISGRELGRVRSGGGWGEDVSELSELVPEGVHSGRDGWFRSNWWIVVGDEALNGLREVQHAGGDIVDWARGWEGDSVREEVEGVGDAHCPCLWVENPETTIVVKGRA